MASLRTLLLGYLGVFCWESRGVGDHQSCILSLCEFYKLVLPGNVFKGEQSQTCELCRRSGNVTFPSGSSVIPPVLSKQELQFYMVFTGIMTGHKVTGISIETDNKNVKAEEFKEAILSCKHKFSKGMSLRIEWKKIQSQAVSFVYYNGEFTGDLKDRAEMLNTGIRIRNVTRKDSGTYRCEISARSEEGQRLGEATITLTVLDLSVASSFKIEILESKESVHFYFPVPPTTPICVVPSSAMTGTVVELSCKEAEGSPPSEYQWYKNGVALLEKTGTGSARTANITYTMNKSSGTLIFNTVSKNDTGEYFCVASNGIGLPQKCSMKRMQVDDLNVSGIIAAVVIVALVMALCGLGVFYAQKKGYFTKESSSQKSNSQSTSEKDFKHTKSFVI
ncbi:UNVERIFIED_CONTAM: hypothetical protein H355_013767 [Colinus virginianus]|nr:hypothetical protein H355_013767 [Colinus virginianus]